MRTKVRVLASILTSLVLMLAIITKVCFCGDGGDLLIAGGFGGAALGISSASVNKKFRKIVDKKSFSEKNNTFAL